MKHLYIALLLIPNFIIAQTTVKTVSAMKPVMMGMDLSAHVDLDSLKKLPNLFAVAPFNRLQGETTVLNGKIYVSTVAKDQSINTNNSFEGTTPFMVYAQVEDWSSFEVDVNIYNELDLQNLVEKVAKFNGYNVDIAFPYLIKGTFDTVNFHIISKPEKEKKHNHKLHNNAKKHYSYSAISGTLVGFYSKHHEGVFTHKRSFTHSHFVDDAETMTGHIENVVARAEKITIYLPAHIQGTANIQLKTIDTDFSKGRLKNEQIINLKDVSKFHGHLCDGLVLGFLGLKEALIQLFPDSVIDRTNVRIISRSSPCLTDIAIYLTGGRYQFNTFYVSDSSKYLYMVQRIDNGKAIGIETVPGLVPKEIKELSSKAVKGELGGCELDSLRLLENDLILKLINLNPNDLFILTEINDFKWSPPFTSTFIKADVLNKKAIDCDEK